MEILLLIIIFLYLYIINRNINAKFEEQNDTIQKLNKELIELKKKPTSIIPKKEKDKQLLNKEISKEPVKSSSPSLPITENIKTPTQKTAINTPIQPQHIQEKKIVAELKKQPLKTTVPKKSWIKRFREKNPDLEKFIGENLINKIGILILVLGISFFVKYAIDKDWINEPARVGIGILFGALVMFIANKLKKNYAAFSSVLVAGAISIFYFTIYIAFHEYQLFSQTVAFAIMVVITAFSTLISISYNRQELAVLSLIGGFAVPFMLSTGSGNYIVLFSYIAILDIGILIISYFRKWKVVTILAFVFTTLLYALWYILESTTSYLGALLYVTLFYFIFSITIVLNNLKNKGVFTPIEYVILVANTFFFFGMGMNILDYWNPNFKGVFTLLLSVYNLIYATVLYKKFGLDKNAIYVLVGLALTFVTLTIPIQFSGNQITIFWAAEVVLLLWLSQKSKMSSFKIGAILVQGLTMLSLFLDWKKYIFPKENLSLFINPLFISGVVVSISLFLTHKLLKKEKEIKTKFFKIDIHFYKKIVVFMMLSVFYLTGVLEIDYQARQFLENKVSAIAFPVTYHYIFIAVALFISLKSQKKGLIKPMLWLSIFSIVAYVVLFYTLPNEEVIESIMMEKQTQWAFYLHYILIICLVYYGYQLFVNREKYFALNNTKYNKWLPWIAVFTIVYIVSNELMIHGVFFTDINIGNKEFESVFNIKKQILKIGFPVLWGVLSFIFLIIGVKRHWKILRIIALSLLGITVLKLFIYDIKDVSETGKIIAFILLGVLVLVISFVYQKIKKLVVDETIQKEKDEE